MTLGNLGFEALVLPAFTQAIDIDDLFRADRNLRGAVIAGSAGQALLTREKLELEMSGRLGFGRALNARTEAHELLPAEVFALSPELDLPTAVTEILARPEELRYHDVLVLVPGLRGLFPSRRFSPACPMFSSTPPCTIRSPDCPTGACWRHGLQRMSTRTAPKLACSSLI
jgi:hypothetical protein